MDPGLRSQGAKATYDLATKTFKIHPDWIDNDLVLIHELIHHYDYGLQTMLWRDFVVIRLYETSGPQFQTFGNIVNHTYLKLSPTASL